MMCNKVFQQAGNAFQVDKKPMDHKKSGFVALSIETEGVPLILNKPEIDLTSCPSRSVLTNHSFECSVYYYPGFSVFRSIGM